MGVVYRRTDSKDAITMLHTGVAGLHHWCKQLTSGYSGVNINDFTSSWRSGLAFCAIIARFRPDLIEFDSLDVSKSYENCKTAFRLAETELNIPALLEASDMVDMRLLDRRSIITYEKTRDLDVKRLRTGGQSVRLQTILTSTKLF